MRQMTLEIDLGSLQMLLSHTAIGALLAMVYQGNFLMKAAKTLRERLVQQQYGISSIYTVDIVPISSFGTPHIQAVAERRQHIAAEA